MACRWHPVLFDERTLLHLPGLPALLARATTEQLETGATWMLTVSQHPGQHRAASSAMHRLVVHSPIAHPLLLWLSTHTAGQHWLRRLYEQGAIHAPLIHAYCVLTDLRDAGRWVTLLEQQRPAFVQQQANPGGNAMLALLDTAVAALQSPRWSAAVQAMQGIPPVQGVVLDEIWLALAALHIWVHAREPMLFDDGDRYGQDLLAELQDLDGWPIGLLEAVVEHLHFLLLIEQRRGACLV
ncbi:MAG: hypothetical protein HC837_20385 [Chloroflexaceae bacterium]|nr:hypothetical protein [Chloroflexaceae bacterium]